MTPHRALSLAALVFALATVAVPAGAFAGGADAEALRQLTLARADLAEGKTDRALHAAKSALRLDPTLYDALLVQGLAHEARGELDEGRALALAYIGAVGWEKADPRATDLLDPYTDAMPVAIDVQREGRFLLVTFAARNDIEDPVLHWRRPNGEWKSEWMGQGTGGDWESTVRVPASNSALVWWVEPTVGRRVIDHGDDGEEKPFLLALR